MVKEIRTIIDEGRQKAGDPIGIQRSQNYLDILTHEYQILHRAKSALSVRAGFVGSATELSAHGVVGGKALLCSTSPPHSLTLAPGMQIFKSSQRVRTF